MKRSIKLFFIITIISFACTSIGQNFEQVDKVINQAIQNSIFPGASILVGTENSILYKKNYGHFSYNNNSSLISDSSLFDMASVTKAFATTFCVMKLVDENKLDIEKPVAFYLPEFAQNGKENILVKDLLIHESGLPAYYSPKDGTRSELIDTIKALKPVYKKNEKTIYSCLNFVTLMLVVESIIKEPMYKFYYENFVNPLHLKNTLFIPPQSKHTNCVPTTDTLQGIVHDPLARALKGLSGNAGLFSTTSDLSVLCKLLLNKGEYKRKRFLKAETIKKFTHKNSERSTRALGFDTRSEDGTASSGKYFSQGTYGHLGYTGTSIWIDPIRKIYVIFLTNRVYPDDTKSMRKVRPEVHDVVITSLENE